MSGTAPWQLRARFDGPHLALYGQSAGTTNWQLLAMGTEVTFTSGTYVWLGAPPSYLVGSFSIREEIPTQAALTHWQGGLSSNTLIATTSTDPNTPGSLHVINSTVYAQDQLVGDNRVLVASFTLDTPVGVGGLGGSTMNILFDMQDSNNYYLFSPGRFVAYNPFMGTFGPGIYRWQNRPNVFTTPVATLPTSCSFAVGQPYTVYINPNAGTSSNGNRIMCFAIGLGNVTAGSQPGTYTYPTAQFGTCGEDIDYDYPLVPPWTGPGYIGALSFSETFDLSFIQWDTTAAINIPWSSFEPKCSSNPNSSGCGDPIDPTTGTYNEPDADLAAPGRGLPLTWSRNYSSFAAAQGIKGPLGYGWFYNYQRTFTVNADSSVTIAAADGGKFTYAYDTANGSYTTPAGNFDHLVKNGDGSYSLTTRARMTSTFQVVNTGGPYLLTKQTDADGNATTFAYNTSNMLVHVTDPAARQLSVSYNTQPIDSFAAGTLITQVGDGTRQVGYGYDSNGNLSTVTDVDGFVTTYVYDSALNPHLLTKRYDPNNNPSTNSSPKYLLNQYAADPIQTSGSGGYHMVQQTDPMGIVTQINYNTPYAGNVR